MTDTTKTSTDPWVVKETWVKYCGNSRKSQLGDTPYKVVAANHHAAGFDAGIFGIQWCDKNLLEVVPAPYEDDSISDWERALYFATEQDVAATVDATFTAAEGGHREILVKEIKRLEERLGDLRKALQVIDSL